MLCEPIDDLSFDHKDLIFNVLTLNNIAVLNKENVRFERIGMNRGFNSAIHRVFLGGQRTLAVKITNNTFNDMLNMLHNRELEFYEWLESSREESDPEDFSHLLKFYGGTKCNNEPGILILDDLSSRVGIQPSYIIGYEPYLVFQMVKDIAGYQSIYLSSDKEVSVGRELIKFDLPVRQSRPGLQNNPWMSEEEKRLLKEWTQPENLFDIQTKIPEGVNGISPVISHCDLWPGNMLFEQKEGKTCLLAFLDWQTFKIGNPLIDIASMIGLNMSTANRREHTEGILMMYVDEMQKRKGGFKKTFEITVEIAHSLLSHAFKWACIELMFAIIFAPNDDIKEENHEMGRLSLRLRDLMSDVMGKMFWTIALIGLALFLFKELYWKRRQFPPGPTPLPLIGNVISILWDFPGMNKYREWKEKFGPIYTYWLGPWPIVTVNDYNLMQEMFVNDGESYADRASFAAVAEFYRGGSFGIADTNGQVWREQRRFALHTLRDFGLGKDAMQERILHEAADLLTQLENDCAASGSTKPLKYLEKTVGSVMNLTLFGFRFDQEHESEFYRLNKLLKDQVQVLANPFLLVFFGIPKVVPYIPIVRGYFEKVFKVRDALYAYFQEHIDAHKAVIDYSNDEVDDFCDAYLKEMHRRRDDPETSFHDRQFINVCVDLWFAGIDTTATTMGWGVVALIHHPEVLAKLHEEFDTVIGSDRLITTADKASLPYTAAFVNEVQRWANIVPQNLLRRLNKDVSINGVSIPEGASVTPQISMLMTDEERDVNVDFRYKQFLPFSIGKRQCPGEGLARMELFLFFANLAHRFHIEAADPSNPPSLVKKMKNGGKPEEFDCVLRRRNVKGSS